MFSRVACLEETRQNNKKKREREELNNALNIVWTGRVRIDRRIINFINATLTFK